MFLKRPERMGNPSSSGSRYVRGVFFLVLGVLAWLVAANLPHEANLGAGGAAVLFGMFGCPLIGGHLIFNAALDKAKKDSGAARGILTTDLFDLPALIIRRIFSR